MNEIAAGRIVQEPKWKEHARTWVFWSGAILALLVGSLAFAVLLHLHSDDTLELYGRGGALFVLQNLPYFWFVALVVFFLVGERYYRRTTFGHRYRTALLLGVYVVLTISLGTVAYMGGVGGHVERFLREEFPAYRSVVGGKESLWDQPLRGTLGGVIVLARQGEISLQSFSGVVWVVDTSNANIRGGVVLAPNEKVKLFGRALDPGVFEASEIRPWEGRGRGRDVR
jgi:hypothetical protein